VKKNYSSDHKRYTISLTNVFLRIHEINFFGVASKSENSRFIVACDDSDYRRGIPVGSRDYGYGRAVLLMDDGTLLWNKDFERPHDAVVSNNGFVAINDWLFGDGLKGKFYIVNPNGKILVEEKFSANLQKLGITNNSKIAWTTTLISNTSDSNQFIFYDVKKGELLFKRDRLFGDIVKANLKEEEIEFITEQNIIYKFNMNGLLLNKDEVEKSIENHSY
jgi:outer membrane protein assembly factor BamB